jgi:hypothetical protein
MGNSLKLENKKCKGSDPLQDLSIGASILLKWNVVIWTGYLGHILCLHHVVCSVSDVEEIGVFVTSDAELSQVDGAMMVCKQTCLLYRKVTAQLAV